MSWVIVAETSHGTEIAGPYTAAHKVRGIYDELRALDMACWIIETKRWWDLTTESGAAVGDVLRETV
jgi:hypothetical protein